MSPPRRTPGFGALRQPGPALPSNAQLKADLLAIGALPSPQRVVIHDVDSVELDIVAVMADGEPKCALITMTDDSGDMPSVVDFCLEGRNLRALAAFLQEHFPNA